jgi:serine/threonine protein kinase
MSTLSSRTMSGTSGIGPGTVYADRLDEEVFFRTERPPKLPLDVIRHVWLSFVGENMLAVLFENGERRYALVVVVEDASRMGWKECQAVSDALKVVERGTRISNESFTDIFDELRTKYSKAEGPRVEHGILLGYVYPSVGSLQNEVPDVLKHTGISFDEEGDVVLRSETFGGQKYSVCVELSTKGTGQVLPSKKQALYKLDCKVLVELFAMLETGDKVDPITFLSYMAVLREKYNYITVERYEGGRIIAANILASRIKNKEPMPAVLAQALAYIRAKPPAPRSAASQSDHNASAASNAPREPPVDPNLPRSPYPGCTYARRLKESGQAKVYAGKFQGKDVAIKVFMEDDSTVVFKRELTMLLKMAKHPNVIDVLDFWEAPEPCVVMNLVKGADMMDHLEKTGPMTCKDARRVALAMADGIAHLHRNGIVHRDLKSSNILIDENGAPIIIDLGLGGSIESRRKPKGAKDMASICATFAESCQMQKSEGILGTVLWLAPEMITANEWGKSTDTYAFGIMLWELLSGKIPFIKPGEDPMPTALLVRIASGERPDMADVAGADQDLKNLMQACWAQKPSDRPSMRTVVDILSGNDPVAIFKSCDQNGDRELDFAEFTAFLKRYAPGSVHPREVYSIFEALDTDGDGSVSFPEFSVFWAQVDACGLTKALANCRGKSIDNDTVRAWLQN